MSFADAVLDWFADQRRELPWRDVDDPYAVLVSEIMLQQTQVGRVVPLFTAFMTRWPRVTDLAAAPLADVLQAWRGLGYNRRAVALHRAAQAIVDRHEGVVPADLDALRALPGIGEYTARAVLAFAFAQDVAPVDTNVRRVLSRGLTGTELRGRALQAAADGAVPDGRGRDWSAALMDLGSRHCTSVPKCTPCPVLHACAWAGQGEDPAAAGRRSAAPFAGSTRFHRGRLLDALRAGPVHRTGLAVAAQLADDDHAAGLGEALVADGLAQWDGEELRLPA